MLPPARRGEWCEAGVARGFARVRHGGLRPTTGDDRGGVGVRTSSMCCRVMSSYAVPHIVGGGHAPVPPCLCKNSLRS